MLGLDHRDKRSASRMHSGLATSLAFLVIENGDITFVRYARATCGHIDT